MARKTKQPQPDEGKLPGPPPRPKSRKERRRKRIWATLYGRGDRCWSFWAEEPTATGITVTTPWDDKKQHFYIGEGEGAYNVSFDEEYGIRRVPLYEDYPTAPIWLISGEWKAPDEQSMGESLDSYITNLELERAAEIESAGEGFPRWGLAMLAMAAMTSAVAILSMILG